MSEMLPLRSECACICHKIGGIHATACCRPDPQPINAEPGSIVHYEITRGADGTPMIEQVGIDPPEPAVLSDRALLAAFHCTDGEPGNPEADALLAEIRRRDLDF
ncbi:hypothetical protein GCM10011380_00880 [Sphingomonas metalli]|uniref:Uncharacterized protein n=1 Tax=Sphingomonas metalli TaxID=1779358 RepID=A0A916SS21_9SPHN|nr:hypothetical protein [Sphingomonas metalli]GGB15262.1 hypothetical protein GCM10011380_00880 [Sphingomonas metalli]